jgi:sphingolipid delta-4 desaturase
MRATPDQFIHTDDPQDHPARAREILARHPEVRRLFGRNPWTALFVVGLVAAQLCVAVALRGSSWVWIVVTAYLVGAFASHALCVLNHESAHNLIFPKQWHNLLLGVAGDVALGFPSAITFRRHHLVHHGKMGQYSVDGDIASDVEARLVGRSALRKVLWVALLGVSQATRPLRLRTVVSQTRGWVGANAAVVVAVDATLLIWGGPRCLAYLVLSTLFALGLHPVGGRWIQEHYVTRPGQETYSYYGPLNAVAFNVGYHNEHHDFAGIPWNRLPKVRQLAGDAYAPLSSYRSWSALLVRFIRDRSITLYSRITRPDGSAA